VVDIMDKLEFGRVLLGDGTSRTYIKPKLDNCRSPVTAEIVEKQCSVEGQYTRII
jgi:hypothetical protein